MNQLKTLGELVRHDRELLGLNQEQLSTNLMKVADRPLDPHTKKPKKFSRSWVAKLESGCLRRGLRSEVRQCLALTLKGDATLYESLPVESSDNIVVPPDFNILPLIKHLAESKKEKLTLPEFSRLCEAYRRCSEVGVSLINPFDEKVS